MLNPISEVMVLKHESAMHSTFQYFVAMLVMFGVAFMGAKSLLQVNQPILNWIAYPLMMYCGLCVLISLYNIGEEAYERYIKKR